MRYNKPAFNDVQKAFYSRGYELLEFKYINATTKMKYKCKKHPQKTQEITWHKFKLNRGCYFCGKERAAETQRYSIEFIKEQFLKLKGYELLETEYKNAHTNMKYRCPHHPDKELYITYNKLQQGGGCAYCANHGKIFIEDVRSAFEKRGYILLSNEYVNAQKKLSYKCRKHIEVIQEIKWNNFQQGKGCRFCNANRSKGEEKISEILSKYNIMFETQKAFPGCVYKRELKFDFYIPHIKMAIEYDGEFHYKPIKMSANSDEIDAFETVKKRDSIKDVFCKTHDIKLLRISYLDKDKIENIIKTEIIYKIQNNIEHRSEP